MSTTVSVRSQKPREHRFLVAIWALAAGALLLSPGVEGGAVSSVARFDKVGHVALFLPGGWLLAPTPRLAVFGLVGFAVTTELAQAQVPGRSPELGDLVADLFGGFLGMALAHRSRAGSTGRARPRGPQ